MNIAPTTPLIAILGRFQPIKGHQYLLDAMPAIRRRVPELKVWFIGDALFGSREERRHKRFLEHRIEREGLSECIQFLGFRSDARRLIRALDALVIPSERESFSMAAVEGLEAGIPVIGPDGWGRAKSLRYPKPASSLNPWTPADLAEKVVQTLLREKDGAAFDPQIGPKRVAACFSAAAHLKRTLSSVSIHNPSPHRQLWHLAIEPPPVQLGAGKVHYA